MTGLMHPPAVTTRQIEDAVARAQTYRKYAENIPVNRDALDANHAAVAFTSDELARLRSIEGQIKILAIVEEWCPDVIANLPIVAQAAATNPAIDLHILPRPDHLAFANAYPESDGRSHIPTYVIFDANDRELGVLIERPAEITKLVKPFGDAVHTEMASRFPGVDRLDLPKDFVVDRVGRGIKMRIEHRDLERRGIVDWIVQAASRSGG